MRNLMSTLTGFIFLLASSVAMGSPDKQALVGGTLIDGYGSTPLQDSVILIEGDRISAVGTVDTLTVPDDFRVISTEGMSVLPGLWDAHVHLMINGHGDYNHWFPTYMDRQVDEIMPASARQLLLAGITSARDLGAPLDYIITVRDRINSGEIPGPRMFVSGPFLQAAPYPGTEFYRWGVQSEAEAVAKVDQLADAGVDFIKLVDQDQMPLAAARALVNQAHKRGLRVVAHSHRPDEIRVGLEIGVDNFEHTGLTSAPQYPDDLIVELRERTARGRVSGGPLYWTPTVEGLWNNDYTLANPEELDNSCWEMGLKPDTIADIKRSIDNPRRLSYFDLTPRRKPTLKRKIQQLRESGVVLLIGTDSGIPMKFHCQSTWNEFDVWVNVMGVPPMEAIRAATYWPAKFMRVIDQTGTVEPGKLADIVAVKGDVLRHINLLSRIDLVMKDGVLYKQDGQPTAALMQVE